MGSGHGGRSGKIPVNFNHSRLSDALAALPTGPSCPVRHNPEKAHELTLHSIGESTEHATAMGLVQQPSERSGHGNIDIRSLKARNASTNQSQAAVSRGNGAGGSSELYHNWHIGFLDVDDRFNGCPRLVIWDGTARKWARSSIDTGR